jgi:branched-chain amino acid transport system substrate-binding protein
VERSANELGFQLVLSELFDPDGGDLAGTVKAILEAAPDVLAVVGRYQNDLAIAKLLAHAAPNVGAVAVVAAGVDGFRERLGDLAEGFVGPSQWEPDAGYAVEYGPSLEEVRASLERAGHPVIDYPLAQAYAVGVVIQRCIQECGSVDDAALREAAALLDFTTFYGRFRIHPETGRQTGKLGLMVQWQQGKKVIVWPPECRERELAYPWR